MVWGFSSGCGGGGVLEGPFVLFGGLWLTALNPSFGVGLGFIKWGFGNKFLVLCILQVLVATIHLSWFYLTRRV